jgi:dolichol-phosphate mannosyltransferase
VIASRYRQGSKVHGVPVVRRLLSTGASWLFRLLFPIKGVRDFTCGFRAYSARALRDALTAYEGCLVEDNGFQCMADVLLKLRRLPVSFREVPMTLRYDLKRGASKMKVARTVGRTLRLLLRRRFAA